MHSDKTEQKLKVGKLKFEFTPCQQRGCGCFNTESQLIQVFISYVSNLHFRQTIYREGCMFLRLLGES